MYTLSHIIIILWSTVLLVILLSLCGRIDGFSCYSALVVLPSDHHYVAIHSPRCPPATKVGIVKIVVVNYKSPVLHKPVVFTIIGAITSH